MKRLINKTVRNTVHPVAKYFWQGSYNYWRPDFRIDWESKSDPYRYYLDFSPKAQYTGPFDDKGVPLTDYGPVAGLQVYPINVAQFGLAHFELWRRGGRSGHLSIATSIGDWLIRSMARVGGQPGFWLADFDWLDNRAPWPSAMAQGQGISLLVRLSRAHRQHDYAAAAEVALAAMRRPVAEGGVATRLASGAAFFQEATNRGNPDYILNGHLFSIWGLHDLARIGVPDAASALREGLAGLNLLLDLFDTGYWSRYDLRSGRLPNLASAFYHELHVRQLTISGYLFEAPRLRDMADRWDRYAGRSLNRSRALALKVAHKLVKY